MSLQDSLFYDDVENDLIEFSKNNKNKRVLIFPPVNNYRRFIIHRLVEERFSNFLHTFSIGQATSRRTVVCYKADVISDPKVNNTIKETTKWNSPCDKNTLDKKMGGEERRSSSASVLGSPENTRQQKPGVAIYRPPAARRLANNVQINAEPVAQTTEISTNKNNRRRRPDRAVYVPRHRRTLDADNSPQSEVTKECPSPDESTSVDRICKSSCESRVEAEQNIRIESDSDILNLVTEQSDRVEPTSFVETANPETYKASEDTNKLQFAKQMHETVEVSKVEKIVQNIVETQNFMDLPQGSAVDSDFIEDESNKKEENSDVEESNDKNGNTILSASSKQKGEDEIINKKNNDMSKKSSASNVIVITDKLSNQQKNIRDPSSPLTPPEKKVKKIERPKSKPAPPPEPLIKVNRDECDWDSLFDDNGDCLDPTLIEELTSAVGEVTIEQPKNDYKAYSKQIEVSSDEFAHVVEIYNFPSEFKTSDLAAVFSPFKTGGFELKWVDDTHCLGVFSSPLIAAEVLASDHPFVKTRPLREATALSRSKARRSAEFLQPYRSRPETCAALARRLVTGALGVKLATARQEREKEKTILREAKEKRRLANKQREEAWEGIVTEK